MNRPNPSRALDTPEQLDLFGTRPVPAVVAGLPDDDARRRIAYDLGASLFVEAGAGAGKTTMLSTRVVSLLADGVPVEGIAAITFTEKAAAELRSRIRADISAALETGRRGARGHEVSVDERERALLVDALDGLDAAAIGTLHSFAQRILREFPIEAGLPPAFVVHDEVASDLAFDERWRLYLDELLADPARAQHFLFSDAAGINLDHLRAIAESFSDNWDLVDLRVDLTKQPPTRFDCDTALAALERLAATPVPPDDSSTGYVADLQAKLSRLRTADDFLRYQLLDETPGKATRIGNQKFWKVMPGGAGALDEFRNAAATCRDLVSAARSAFHEAWSDALGAELGALTVWSAQERRERGELDFHDLLVFARDLLEGNESVRRILHERFRVVLLDEFQDTDPIQLELALRLTAAPDVAGSIADLQPLPGRLFIVGDPKQSIYRFRRADMAMYLRAQQTLAAEQLALHTNFRSRGEVLAWLNHVFGELIQGVPDAQPEFRALHAFRSDSGMTGSVTVLGELAHGDAPAADEVRRREAAELAATVLRVRREGWDVGGLHGAERRAARLGDIAILVPARTLLPFIESAFVDAGIPFQAENSSLVYATTEIRDLMMCLRAIADPSDELATVSVLRSALFGCSDVELYEWKQRGGSFHLRRRSVDDSANDWANESDPAGSSGGPDADVWSDQPVADALQWLRRLHDELHVLTPSEILLRIVTGRRMFETALVGPSPRDVWRRLRFVLDQARAWSDAGGIGIRSYLEWARRLGGEGRYLTEGVLPETDLDAVRIMTVHAAKGLEFPVVMVAGLSTKPMRTRGHRVVWTTDGWSLAKGERHEAFKPLDEQLSHLERLRLLYVACTRAQDHLVVSMHRVGDVMTPADNATSSELMAWACAAAAPTPPPQMFPGGPEATLIQPPTTLPWRSADDWRQARDAIIERAARPSSISATAFAEQRIGRDPAVRKDAVDLEQPAWQRGRYGTAIGRAVHGVLQMLPLAQPSVARIELVALSAAQAAAEGVETLTDTVAALTDSALRSPSVVALKDGREHWKELYVGTQLGTTVVEGYIDLLIRTPDGLVVVDYKTDIIPDVVGLQYKIERYSPQLAVYGVALESVLGEPVVGARLVFCSPEQPAHEVAIDDWADQLSAVREAFAPSAVDDSAHRGNPAG